MERVAVSVAYILTFAPFILSYHFLNFISSNLWCCNKTEAHHSSTVVLQNEYSEHLEFLVIVLGF